jgi:hypothetical protein
VSNINACTAVADVVRTTLGPRGMDKLIHDHKGAVTISNDGATIMKLLDIVHPAAKILVDIAKSQDSEVSFSVSIFFFNKLFKFQCLYACFFKVLCFVAWKMGGKARVMGCWGLMFVNIFDFRS